MLFRQIQLVCDWVENCTRTDTEGEGEKGWLDTYSSPKCQCLVIESDVQAGNDGGNPSPL